MSPVSRRSLLLSIAPLLAAARAARAQQEQDKVFKSEVKVVNVLATVRTKKGEIVHDLKQEDFDLAEDGRPQTIKYFSRETDLPLTLGLLVDTSGSQRRLIGEEQTASYKFFDQVLREDKDVAFLIHFDSEVELLQDLTSSRRALQDALNNLGQTARPQLNRSGGQGGQTSGGGYPGGGYPGGGGGGGRRSGRGGGGGAGTCLYDSVLLGSDELMSKQKGRKALVLLTDGVDNGSQVSLPRSIESAQRADTLVYSLLFEDKEAYNTGNMGGFGRHGGGMGRQQPQMQHADGKKVLQQLAQETGGGFFEVSKKHPLDETFRQLQEELRNQYSIGYTPADTGSHFGAYRKITLTTKKKDLVVQAREGYYADRS